MKWRSNRTDADWQRDCMLSGFNLTHLIPWAFRVWRNREYIIYRDQRLTRAQVWDNLNALSAGLQALGARKGDRIATLLPARPEAIYSIFLPNRIRTVNVPLNPFWRESELRHVLADAGAKIVITQKEWFGQDYPAMLAHILHELPALKYVIVCDEISRFARNDNNNFLPYARVAIPGRAPRAIPARMDDLILLAYTSGTTGKPKGIAHSSATMWGMPLTQNLGHLFHSPLRCLLLPFAPYQYAGIFGAAVTLFAGGKIVLMDRFEPRRALELIAHERATQVGLSPTMARLMLSVPEQTRFDLSSVQRITFSTEPCPRDLAEALRARFNCHLQNFYGTTESMMIAWTTPDDPWERAATTVGKPVPGARVRIVDDARRAVPLGQPGEIAVQTKQMMIGYYNDPALTAQVLDRDGWYYTGDIGVLGADGFLRVVDRKKDLIIRGGQNIFPAEIEVYLQTHPAIRRAAVIGVPDAISGESVCAYIETIPGARLTATNVLDFCRGQIAPYKIPEQVFFVERLPVTGSNKVEKYKLRELARTANL
ncbi:MAG: acyl--CoA ligase [Chloroflexi bacterium]|nr:acyl--CoA ligase [Chloroflexota bacterium]